MMCAFNWPVSEPYPRTRRSVIVRAGEQSRDSSVSKSVEMVAIGQRLATELDRRIALQRTWSSADTTFTTDIVTTAAAPLQSPAVYDVPLEYRLEDCCPCENESASDEEMRIIHSVCRLASYGHHSNAMDINNSSTHLRHCRQLPPPPPSSSFHDDAGQHLRTAMMPATSNTGGGSSGGIVHQQRRLSSCWSPIHHRSPRSMSDQANVDLLQPQATMTSVELPMRNLRERLTSIERSSEVGTDDTEGDDIAEFADVHHADSDGDLSIHIAVAKENEIHVSQLIHLMTSSDWTLDVYNNMKQTPLHVAIVTGHLNIVKRLLAAGCSPLLPDRHGNNALHLAVSCSSLACINVLLECPSSVMALQQRNYMGYTPLHLAVFRHDTDLVGLLVAKGAECNVMDGTSGRTPLYHAIVNGHEDVVRKLVSLGASVNMANYAGVTPLVVATDRRLKNITSLLISRGAAVNSRDDHT